MVGSAARFSTTTGVPTTTAERTSWHEGCAAARLSRGTQNRGGRRAEGHRTTRRGGADRSGGTLPDRSAHSGGAVGGEVARQPAVHAWTRERRLGSRGRLGGDRRR